MSLQQLALGGGYIFGVMLVLDAAPAQAVAVFDMAMEVWRYPISWRDRAISQPARQQWNDYA